MYTMDNFTIHPRKFPLKSYFTHAGAQDDLNRVTKWVYDQIRQLGMNDVIGQMSFPKDGSEFGAKPYSKKMARIIDEVLKSPGYEIWKIIWIFEG